MKFRTTFLCILVAAALLSSLAVDAQPSAKVARVGVLVPGTSLYWDGYLQVFRRQISELGWVEGRNLALEIRYADDQYDRLTALATELVASKPDVLFTATTGATQAAARATSTIPIVFETLGDAVDLGLVSNLARPERNVTGVSGFSPELSAKRLELIREIVPGVKRIGVVANPDNPIARPMVHTIEAAVRALPAQFELLDVRAPGDLEHAFQQMAQHRVGAVLLVADPMLFSQSQRIVDLAARYRQPAVYEQRMFAERGGLLSYGPFVNERFQRMAVYVDRILRGARPSELPVERPTKFELVVNLKAAKAQGFTIPQSVLLRADLVIE